MEHIKEDSNVREEKIHLGLSNSSNTPKLNQNTNCIRGEETMESFNMEIDVTNIGSTKPADGGWGWMIVAGSFLVMFLLDGVCLSYGLFLGALESSFQNVSKLQMMFAGSLITGCYLIMGPVASALSNKYGFRALVIAGTIISSAAMFISTFMYNIGAFILVYGLGGGIGFSLIYLPGCTIIALWFEKYRATATGIAICGSGCGAALFSVLIPYLIDRYSWRGCLIILAAVNLNCLVAAALFKPMKSRPPKITLCSPKEMLAVDNKLEQMITDYARQTIESDRRPDSLNDAAPLFHCKIVDMSNTNDSTRKKSIGSLNSMIITCDSTVIEDTAQDYNQRIMNLGIIRNIVCNYLNRQETKRIRRVHSNFNLFNRSKRNSFVQSQHSMLGSCIIASQPQLVSTGTIHRSIISLKPSLDHTIPLDKDMTTRLSNKLSTELSRPSLKPDLYYPGSTQHLNNENIQFVTSQCTLQGTGNEELSPIRIALQQLMDVSILKSFTVQLSLISNFVGMFGYLIPFQFLVSHAALNGIGEMKSATLLTILGLGSCLGRILSGCLADLKWANCVIIHNTCLIIAGIDTMLLPLMSTYTSLVIFVLIYAFSTAAVISLKTIVIVDVMGTEKLTNIFGWTILAQGIAILFGPPLLGSFYDFIQNYSYTFILGGALLSLSGIIGAPLRLVAKLESKGKDVFVSSKKSLTIEGT